jgi:hypothetical protein
MIKFTNYWNNYQGAIFGDVSSSNVKSNAKVVIDTTFTSFDLTGFAISPNLWEILR